MHSCFIKTLHVPCSSAGGSVGSIETISCSLQWGRSAPAVTVTLLKLFHSLCSSLAGGLARPVGLAARAAKLGQRSYTSDPSGSPGNYCLYGYIY